jgi:hypothetical protein
MIVDYFMRRGWHQAEDWLKWGSGAYWYTGGIYWPGVVAVLVGIAASIAFSNSPTYVSPLMRDYLRWGDLSFEFGLLSAALTYFVMARRHPQFQKSNRTFLSPVTQLHICYEHRRSDASCDKIYRRCRVLAADRAIPEKSPCSSGARPAGACQVIPGNQSHVVRVFECTGDIDPSHRNA